MAAKKKAAKKSPAKKAAKRTAKKSSAKKSSAKKAVKRPAKKAAKKSVKKSVKKSAKKVAKKSAKRGSGSAKIVIPPVPSRSSTPTIVSTTPKAGTSSSAKAAPAAPAKKGSSRVTLLVLLGILILGLIVSNRNNSSDDAAPTPTESATISESPTPEASAEALAAHEAPLGFVAITNASGGVTLRWKTPAAAEGITGYNISVSYNAKDFTLVSTVPANQLNLDVAKAGDEGGTQFLIQTVYSDGQTVDGKKFSLAGKYA
ncbi:unannotated protein [freshwater metagenome]|uniref:Unannotated protein n=1 Tax=freshwater metagenome TaxID=449393 RepID=A0A6J6XW92_9ZZZZ|nr:hypothetical protein [Actinomycetota bacterium]MSW15890.1 hypothetical protein [Actinomycetota bacterium]MSX44430.1 hypothetical protein [Actinomycetota bacterium]MSX84966.1 hypothetical protein [Actinomycetota bacterium]MSY23427.1 hypothetical protein [Actinomycetota bacterium]